MAGNQGPSSVQYADCCKHQLSNMQLLKEKIVSTSALVDKYRETERQLKKKEADITELNLLLERQKNEIGNLMVQLEQALKSPKSIVHTSNAILQCDDGSDKDGEAEEVSAEDIKAMRLELQQKDSTITSMKVYVGQLEAEISSFGQEKQEVESRKEEIKKLKKDVALKDINYKDAMKRSTLVHQQNKLLKSQLEDLTHALQTSNDSLMSMEIELNMLREGKPLEAASKDAVEWESTEPALASHEDPQAPFSIAQSDVSDKPFRPIIASSILLANQITSSSIALRKSTSGLSNASIIPPGSARNTSEISVSSEIEVSLELEKAMELVQASADTTPTTKKRRKAGEATEAKKKASAEKPKATPRKRTKSGSAVLVESEEPQRASLPTSPPLPVVHEVIPIPPPLSFEQSSPSSSPPANLYRTISPPRSISPPISPPSQTKTNSYSTSPPIPPPSEPSSIPQNPILYPVPSRPRGPNLKFVPRKRPATPPPPPPLESEVDLDTPPYSPPAPTTPPLNVDTTANEAPKPLQDNYVTTKLGNLTKSTTSLTTKQASLNASQDYVTAKMGGLVMKKNQEDHANILITAEPISSPSRPEATPDDAQHSQTLSMQDDYTAPATPPEFYLTGLSEDQGAVPKTELVALSGVSQEFRGGDNTDIPMVDAQTAEPQLSQIGSVPLPTESLLLDTTLSRSPVVAQDNQVAAETGNATDILRTSLPVESLQEKPAEYETVSPIILSHEPVHPPPGLQTQNDTLPASSSLQVDDASLSSPQPSVPTNVPPQTMPSPSHAEPIVYSQSPTTTFEEAASVALQTVVSPVVDDSTALHSTLTQQAEIVSKEVEQTEAISLTPAVLHHVAQTPPITSQTISPREPDSQAVEAILPSTVSEILPSPDAAVTVLPTPLSPYTPPIQPAPIPQNDIKLQEIAPTIPPQLPPIPIPPPSNPVITSQPTATSPLRSLSSRRRPRGTPQPQGASSQDTPSQATPSQDTPSRDPPSQDTPPRDIFPPNLRSITAQQNTPPQALPQQNIPSPDIYTLPAIPQKPPPEAVSVFAPLSPPRELRTPSPPKRSPSPPKRSPAPPKQSPSPPRQSPSPPKLSSSPPIQSISPPKSGSPPTLTRPRQPTPTLKNTPQQPINTQPSTTATHLSTLSAQRPSESTIPSSPYSLPDLQKSRQNPADLLPEEFLLSQKPTSSTLAPKQKTTKKPRRHILSDIEQESNKRAKRQKTPQQPLTQQQIPTQITDILEEGEIFATTIHPHIAQQYTQPHKTQQTEILQEATKSNTANGKQPKHKKRKTENRKSKKGNVHSANRQINSVLGLSFENLMRSCEHPYVTSMINELNRSTGVEPPSPPTSLPEEDMERHNRPHESPPDYIKRRILKLFTTLPYSPQLGNDVSCDIKSFVATSDDDVVLRVLFNVLEGSDWSNEELVATSLLTLVSNLAKCDVRGTFEGNFLKRAAMRIVEPSAVTPVREAVLLCDVYARIMKRKDEESSLKWTRQLVYDILRHRNFIDNILLLAIAKAWPAVLMDLNNWLVRTMVVLVVSPYNTSDPAEQEIPQFQIEWRNLLQLQGVCNWPAFTNEIYSASKLVTDLFGDLTTTSSSQKVGESDKLSEHTVTVLKSLELVGSLSGWEFTCNTLIVQLWNMLAGSARPNPSVCAAALRLFGMLGKIAPATELQSLYMSDLRQRLGKVLITDSSITSSLLVKICTAQSLIDLSNSRPENLQQFGEWYKTVTQKEKERIPPHTRALFDNTLGSISGSALARE